jgi:hypothetical protein
VVKQVSALDYLARSAGLIPLFVTIRAPKGEPAAKGKRFIAKRLGHLGQSLQRDTRSRRGQPHIGMTVYEVAPDESHLHAHHIVYLTRRADMKIVARWADVFEPKRTGKRHDVTMHARPACLNDIGYMTKQRLPLSPDFEANTTHRRKPGGFIPGPRWALTKHFRAMAALERSEVPPPVRPLIEAP